MPGLNCLTSYIFTISGLLFLDLSVDCVSTVRFDCPLSTISCDLVGNIFAGAVIVH